MKKLLTSVLLTVVFFGGNYQARAGIPILWDYDAEKCIKIADFPHTDEYKTKDGIHVDAGYIYKQLRIFWVPVWNYDERWCGYLGNSDKYLIITKEELGKSARMAGIALPPEPILPLWDSYGGKLVFAVVLAVFVLSYLRRGTNNEKPSTPQPPNLILRQKAAEKRPDPVPVSIPLSAKLQKTAQSDLKCCCGYCGQKLAFDPSMIGRNIQCPSCNREISLFSS